MLKLKNITKDYKVAQGSVHALKGISLSFRKNEFVSVLGPSGCGKTTLLNIIGGLDHYTSGDLVIQGRSTKDFMDRDWDVYRNHRIGFIFQSYNLIPHQTVLSNVELALTIAGVGKEERRERAKKALERVGLGEELNKRPNQLSGGQMQRVAIARALVNNPDILLADEPTGALDSKTSVEVMELIKEISAERLVIMVTHNPELAEKYSTRIVRLMDGQVESDSDPYSEEEEAKENAGAAEAAEEEKPKKGGKKPRAKMSFFTSLALSAKNLFTKKGRTIITSVAGSIGIISVCLVLALSNGFNTYIEHTEEDMLSYYPLEIEENTLDLNAVMDKAGSSLSNMPDTSQIGDKVYVDSFLTQLAQGIAVTNNLSEEYLSYLEKGKEVHPDWFAAIKYGYGISLVDNLFTDVETGGVPLKDGSGLSQKVTQYLSLSGLRDLYTDEITTLAPEYSALVQYVNFFDDVVGVMPGTTDFGDEEYAKYVLSQYDIIDPETMHFPKTENEAVLVVGDRNEATDLTLAQLGFIPEDEFVTLFKMGEESNEENREPLTYSYEKVLSKNYVLYYNDAVYAKGAETGALSEQPFVYSDARGDLAYETEGGKALGIPLRISAILRLKEGRTYGCLTNGLNFTEAALLDYIKGNKESEIVKWMTGDKAKLPDEFTKLITSMAGTSGTDSDAGEEQLSSYRSPSSHLNTVTTESMTLYTPLDLGSMKTNFGTALGTVFLAGMDRTGAMLGAGYPFGGEEISREAAHNFMETYKSMIAGNEFGTQEANDAIGAIGRTMHLNIPTIDRSPIGTETVDAMIAEIDKLGTVFTRTELVTALGIPLVTKYIEPKLGNISLEGIVFLTFASDTAVRRLGGSDDPNDIFIYPTNFDAKDHVLEYLDAWNNDPARDEGDKITYTDRVGLLMGIMQTMLNVITYVLVAFTSISLVVSSVMIGIITYVSVVERVKEIGVLRSLGARKMDIRNLFNAETFIIGLAAGLIGVAVTYILSGVVSAIIYSLSGIAGIATLPPLTAFIMVCVSVALTLISGLIPAQAAAKKDPVIALRTE